MYRIGEVPIPKDTPIILAIMRDGVIEDMWSPEWEQCDLIRFERKNQPWTHWDYLSGEP